MAKKIRALSVGAVLWDIVGGREYIGGAPFNVAVNLARLGAESLFITRVGSDARGERALEKMREYGVGTRFVQRDGAYATGIARALLDKEGNASYEIPRAAFDEISLSEEDIAKLNAYAPDVICFGSFEQRYAKSAAAIAAVTQQVRAGCVFFDVNIRMDFCEKEVLAAGFAHTDVLKLNEDECARISRLFYGEELPPEKFCPRAAEEFAISAVLVTLGDKGCFVYGGKEGTIVPSAPVRCVDTIGAGDAFSGAFLYAYLSGKDVVTAARCGNYLGGYVAGRAGALPDFTEEVFASLEEIMKKGK